MNLINGKKTYVAAALSIGLGLYTLITGETVAGVSPDNAAEFIVAGLGMIGFRSAMGK